VHALSSHTFGGRGGKKKDAGVTAATFFDAPLRGEGLTEKRPFFSLRGERGSRFSSNNKKETIPQPYGVILSKTGKGGEKRGGGEGDTPNCTEALGKRKAALVHKSKEKAFVEMKQRKTKRGGKKKKWMGEFKHPNRRRRVEEKKGPVQTTKRQPLYYLSGGGGEKKKRKRTERGGPHHL